MILARFDTTCPCCGEAIYAGDPIGLVDTHWLCEPCVEDAGGEDE